MKIFKSKPLSHMLRLSLNSRVLWFVTIVCLLLLFSWASYNKFHRATSLPFFNASDGTGFYLRDSSFDFRLCKMIVDGTAQFSHDVNIQYPEGLDVSRYYTPLMNWFSGSLYRILGRPGQLHVFLLLFISIFSSLMVIAVFIASYALFSSRKAGLFSALLYALTPATFIDVASGNFVHQDFTLPFLFLAFACFVWCFKKDDTKFALIGSLLIAISLASWHLTEFYLLLVVGGFIATFFLQPEKFPKKSFTVLTLVCFAASLVLPVLRAKMFVFSPALMTAYGFTISLFLFARNKDGRYVIVKHFIVIALFLLTGLTIQILLGNQSHVVQILLAKIRYLGQIPLDPAKLSFEARVYWQSGYVGPELADFVSGFNIAGLLGSIILFVPISKLIKKRARSEEIFLLYHIFATVLLFILFTRFSAFAAFYLLLPLGYIFLVNTKIPKLVVYGIAGLSIVLALINEKNISMYVPYEGEYPYNRDIMSFISKRTSVNDAILCDISIGGMIAAYTDRPVTMHGMFESKRLRDKVREVYSALYKPEIDFYEVCQKYKVRYFVYQSVMALGHGPYSMRYFAGVNRLSTSCAVYLFQFAPDKLKHFDCVHQNDYYRIYRVCEEQPIHSAIEPYIPIYDPSMFTDTTVRYDFMEDSVIEHGIQNIQM